MLYSVILGNEQELNSQSFVCLFSSYDPHIFESLLKAFAVRVMSVEILWCYISILCMLPISKGKIRKMLKLFTWKRCTPQLSRLNEATVPWKFSDHWMVFHVYINLRLCFYLVLFVRLSYTSVFFFCVSC